MKDNRKKEELIKLKARVKKTESDWKNYTELSDKFSEEERILFIADFYMQNLTAALATIDAMLIGIHNDFVGTVKTAIDLIKEVNGPNPSIDRMEKFIEFIESKEEE